MFGVGGWEFVLLVLIAVFVLGPDKLPEYAAKLAQWIRKLRVMAEGAKDQLRDQLGPEYEDIDWRQYDPRQYDPRRIVREALLDPIDDAVAPVRDEIGSVRSAARIRGDKDGAKATDASNGSGGARAAAAAAAATAAVPTADEVDEPVVGPRPRTPAVPRDFDPARPTPYDVEAT
ncbi:Sec-independent protein translocase subunit TatB [Phycicoccus sp. BSK3Z-2]|uniref:Sec-independent protein translocase protein TatB n=1 Tax=Phycicoccus avicenniae TaxID=2828860 RepID=A0A941D9I0_9MICO|nr:Sec-independent protein translocase subunit TatB [Phycicoccus avicenniae]MBR7742952.1 Sec-independent protein translocase subunit TatB [Phycicoccus avicenniae]